MKKYLVVILLLIATWSNATEIEFKTLFVDHRYSWQTPTTSITLNDDTSKKQTLFGIYAALNTRYGASFFYEGIFNSAGQHTLNLVNGIDINNILISNKDKAILSNIFEVSRSCSYNSFGVEYFLNPIIRPLLKVEQSKYSLALISPSQQIDLNINQYNAGVGIAISQTNPDTFLQGKIYYLVGKDTFGWDIDVTGRWFTRGSYVGGGYRYKDITTGKFTYGFSGPYLELGVIY
jgi:hypothetical protein